MNRLLVLLPLLSLTLAAPAPEPWGYNTDITTQQNANLQDDEAQVSLKEICYRDLYADVQKFNAETEKEVLIQDDFGKDVFLFDGFRKDENDVEFYYKEFCYKSVNIQAHNEDVDATNTAVIDKRGGFGLDGGKGGFGGKGFDGKGFDGKGLDGKGFDGKGGFGKGGFGKGGFDGKGFDGKGFVKRDPGFDGGFGGKGKGGFGGKGFDGKGFDGKGFDGKGFDGKGKGGFGGKGFDGKGFDGGQGRLLLSLPFSSSVLSTVQKYPDCSFSFLLPLSLLPSSSSFLSPPFPLVVL